jgi:Xaa-Pro aminopeptidase
MAAAPELRVGADGELRYLPDADLYYLTGYVEPEAVLVLCPSAESPCTLFVRPRDRRRERWTGVRGGVEAAREQFGADAAYPVAELPERLPQLIAGADLLYVALESGRPEVDAAWALAMAEARRSRPRSGRGPHTLVDPRLLLGPMRVVKDAREIELVREAARITADAFVAAHGSIRGADGEWQVEAALEHAFRNAGASGPAFPSIVAGGANATVLHYITNDARSGPASWCWSMAVRASACTAATSAARSPSGRFTPSSARCTTWCCAPTMPPSPRSPGRTVPTCMTPPTVCWRRASSNSACSRHAAGVLERGEHRRYYPHRTSHWLGLDVHDVGDYALPGGAPVRLRPGMVLTIEPGLYVPADDDAAPAALRGTGVRLEDDLLVTADGHENLTAAMPITADDIEALLAS